jgi:uncharacterized protein (TIGR02117 family)
MVLLAALGLLACASRPAPAPLPPEAATETLHLIARDWHTEVGLDVRDLQGRLALLAAWWPGAGTLAIGFGDRAYLLSRERSLPLMAQALLPGPGAMLVTGLSAPPEDAFGADSALRLRLTPAGMRRVQKALEASFEWDAGDEPVHLADGPYLGSVFLASALRYSALYTCNTWTAEMLAEAGLPVRVAGVLFAGQVMRQGRAVARAADP